MELPLYKNIYYELKEKLLNNFFDGKEYLPSETKLMKEYSCSRDTIRKSLDLLINQNIIKPIKGKGYKIINIKSLDKTVDDKYQNLINLFQNKELYHRELLAFEEIIIDENIHKKTALPLGKAAYKVIKKRSLENKPVVLEETIYIKDLIPTLNKEIASKSIYKHFAKENFWEFNLENIIYTNTLDKIEIDFYDINKFVTEHNLVIIQNFHTYDKFGNLFEFTQTFVHPDYFAIRI